MCCRAIVFIRVILASISLAMYIYPTQPKASMQTIDELNRKFAIGQVARFEPGQGQLPKLNINAPAGQAQIYLHGAHVAHFQPKGHSPVIFLSSKSFFEPGKAIRGGVPVIFPWFGPRNGDKNSMHGLVRTRNWIVEEVARAGDTVKAVFAIASSNETKAIWNHDFQLRLIITVGSTLTMELAVQNTSVHDFVFEEALHTYYAVGDVREIAIAGLSGSTYVDKNNFGPEIRVDAQNPMRFSGPTDRIYQNQTATCTITDPLLKRRIIITKENSHSMVVWSPWSDKIGGFVDMLPDEWVKFCCVETCNVRDHAIALKAGENHVHRSTIHAEAM